MIKKRWTLALALIVALIIATAGCGGKAEKKEEGSKSGKTSITIAGSTSVQPLSDELVKAYTQKNPNVTINVQGGGSSQGIKAAVEGIAQIGASSRELKESEKTNIKETIIALDGIAIAVHPKNNKVTNLSIEQVKRIFSGTITNWKEVGGVDATISVVTREAGSGTRGAFEEIVMHDAKITDKAITQASNGAIRTTVAGDEKSIGYLSLGFISADVKGIKVDTVEPTVENVKNNTYKVKRPFLYLTKGDPTGEIKSFIDFVLSPAGQEVVGKHYIKVR